MKDVTRVYGYLFSPMEFLSFLNHDQSKNFLFNGFEVSEDDLIIQLYESHFISTDSQPYEKYSIYLYEMCKINTEINIHISIDILFDYCENKCKKKNKDCFFAVNIMECDNE